MLIWIRHAPKEYANGKGPTGSKQYDSPVDFNFDTIMDIEDLVNTLIKSYGKPTRIVTSPFLRTRQTSLYIREYIKDKYNHSPDIQMSKDVSEFLGFCRRVENPQENFQSETFAYMDKNVRFDETQSELRQRVNNHINEVRNYDGCTWIVTHGIVMSRIYEILIGEKLYRPRTLEYFPYDNQNML
jgi:broad specificity phosphatase PhoE